jgi:Uma2 family endonuclease
MPVKALVSAEEYLHTSFEVDCDYVDGELVERNWGERDHSICQGLIYAYFLARANQWGVYPLVELRVQVSPTRFRVPDVCVVSGGPPREQIPAKPPLIAIEILSPEDRMSVVEKKVHDYLNFGIPNVWVIDPYERQAFLYTPEARFEARDLILRTRESNIELPLPEIFGALQ